MRRMRLEKVSLNPPAGLQEFLLDLGEGENGFIGSPVHNGGVSLQEYLRSCCDMYDESTVQSGFVPETVFWLINSENSVVGMIKVRHRLSEKTRINGGHIGFYIHTSHRRKGYATKALALALDELVKIGESEALITAYPENKASIRTIESNGGRYSDTVFDPETKHAINRYWVCSKT